MPLIYRTMTVVEGKPVVGDSARSLGVRIGDASTDDIRLDDFGNVHPGTGGMSVAPSWRDLESHRIPKRLSTAAIYATGSNHDACWRMGDGEFCDAVINSVLRLTVTDPIHGVVGPEVCLSKEQFRSALADTLDQWSIDES